MSSTLAARGDGFAPAPIGVGSGAEPVGSGPAGLPADRPGFRPDIEGLRAVAILLVVAYHVGVPAVRGGYVGVDVFFVISGFIITAHLLREVDATGTLAIGRFYARRAMRLLPAASLVIVVTLIGTWYWLPVTRERGITRDALSAAGYVINYRLAVLGTDYRTATLAPSPLQHFWSLAVEEQFYLLWPVLLVVATATVLLRRRAAFTAIVALITVASLAWSIRSSGRSAVWAYYAAPSRIWELGAGALTAVAVLALTRLPRPIPTILRWLGIAAIALSAWHFDQGTSFPGYHALLPVGGAVAVIAAGCAEPSALLGAAGLRAIGARSYSWYLWHWPVLIIAPYVVVRDYGTTQKVIAAGIGFALACLSYEFVERPLREHPVLRAEPWRAALTGLGLTTAVVALALLLPIVPARLTLGASGVGGISLTGHGSARTAALARKLTTAAAVRNLPRNLTPSLRQAATDDPAIARDGCEQPFEGLSTPRHCEHFAAAGSKTVLVLFGDSHAAQWYPAVQAIARQRHWRLAVFTKVACNAASVTIYLPPLKRAYTECATWRNRALARIRALHPRVVVTTSNADGGNALGVKGSQDSIWTRAWTETVRRLTRPGTRVVYLNDTPWPRRNVPDCVALHPHDVESCAQSTELATKPDRRVAMADAAAQAGATVVDPTPWFCAPRICPVVVGNILVYKDESHVSGAYARLLTPLLGEKIPALKQDG